MTLLEGHAEYVMDGVGPDVIPSVEEIRSKFTRRRETANPLDRVLRKLLGVDVKLRQYAEGRKFVHSRRRAGRHGGLQQDLAVAADAASTGRADRPGRLGQPGTRIGRRIPASGPRRERLRPRSSRRRSRRKRPSTPVAPGSAGRAEAPVAPEAPVAGEPPVAPEVPAPPLPPEAAEPPVPAGPAEAAEPPAEPVAAEAPVITEPSVAAEPPAAPVAAAEPPAPPVAEPAAEPPGVVESVRADIAEAGLHVRRSHRLSVTEATAHETATEDGHRDGRADGPEPRAAAEGSDSA